VKSSTVHHQSKATLVCLQKKEENPEKAVAPAPEKLSLSYFPTMGTVLNWVLLACL